MLRGLDHQLAGAHASLGRRLEHAYGMSKSGWRTPTWESVEQRIRREDARSCLLPTCQTTSRPHVEGTRSPFRLGTGLFISVQNRHSLGPHASFAYPFAPSAAPRPGATKAINRNEPQSACIVCVPFRTERCSEAWSIIALKVASARASTAASRGAGPSNNGQLERSRVCNRQPTCSHAMREAISRQAAGHLGMQPADSSPPVHIARMQSVAISCNQPTCSHNVTSGLPTVPTRSMAPTDRAARRFTQGPCP